MNEPKRLYRVEREAKLAGVCGGVAEDFNIDAHVVRLIWVIVTLISFGVGLVLYLVAAFLLPKKSEVYPGY